jgi:hypothetical protein
MKHNLSAVLALFLVILLPLHGFQRETGTSFVIRKESVGPVIDGVLSEALWNRTPELNHLLVLQPDRFTPEKIQTSVKVFLSENKLFVGLVCVDSEPEKIKAEISIRDGDIRVDDSLYVLLDLFENIDNYYFVAVNAAGTKTDGVVRKDGQVVNSQWNGDWEVAVQRTSQGWDAEFAIDLSTLMFLSTEGESFGLSVSRVVPRLDTSFWSEPMEPAFRAEDIQILDRLSVALAVKWIEAIPYIMPTVQEDGRTEIQVGIDIPFNFNPQVRSHITVNPDFFTVEPDRQVFNLTRYELDIPEQRTYLMDSSDIFGVSHEKLFYSKRLGDLYGGAKFHGRFGVFELSAMSNQAKKTPESKEASANFSVLRLKSQLGKKSSLGILAANKAVGQENFGTAGLNAAFGLTDQLGISGQFAASHGKHSDENITFTIAPSYDTETFHFHAGFTHVGKNFGDNANSVGYVWDDNRREIDSVLEKSFVMQKWGIEFIRYTSRYNIYWGTQGTLRSWELNQGFSLLKQNMFELNVMHTQDFKLFEKEYRNNRTRLFMGFDTREWQLFNIILTMGKNFDQIFRLAELNKRFVISRQLSMEYVLQFLNTPHLGGNRSTKAWFFHLLKFTNTFSRKLSLEGFFQYSGEAEKTNVQLFLFYRFRGPSGLLQAGLQKGDPRYGLAEFSHTTFLIKCAYAF